MRKAEVQGLIFIQYNYIVVLDNNGVYTQISTSRTQEVVLITNEKQYRIGQTLVKKFETALAPVVAGATGLVDSKRAKILKARRDYMQGQLAELRQHLGEYEQLKSGGVKNLAVHGFGDIPLALIRARVVAGLTQADLALRLGVKAQQVQRDETNLYRHASFERIEQIARVLGVALQGEVLLD